MATRKPLVLISGVSSELPPGDLVPGIDTTAQASGNAALVVGATALASGNAALVVGTTALASGNAALVVGATALASGNAALSNSATAQASGNAALTGLSNKYDKTGGPISGPAFTQSQTFGVPSGLLGSGVITLDFGRQDNFEVTLTASSSILSNPVNASGGQCGALVLRQDSVGTRLLTYSGVWGFVSNTAPTLTTTASGVDMLAYYVVNPSRINVVSNLNYGSGTIS
jgi:hypothetical protein